MAANSPTKGSQPQNAAGTGPSFDAIILRYRTELVNQALVVLGSMEDAEDVVQDTFCEAFARPKELATARSLRAWLRRINHTNIMDHVRNKKYDSEKPRKKKRDLRPKSATTGGFTALEWRDFLSRAIEQLPQRMRPVVVLRFWENLSFLEIEQRIGIPKSTVCRILYQATQMMYEKLANHLDLPAGELSKQLDSIEILKPEVSENSRP